MIAKKESLETVKKKRILKKNGLCSGGMNIVFLKSGQKKKL